MPVLQRLVSLNRETVIDNKFESTCIVRKVRIICSDPYATDSSEDEGILSKDGKRFVREILLPISSYRVSNASLTEGSFQGSEDGGKTPRKKRVLTFRGKKPSLSSRNYKGIRPRKWGKWAAEIRDPVKQKRIWLGTCRSAEEALMPYETKRNEFEASANSTGCGEEKISCSLVLSKCSNDQNQNLADVSASIDLSLSTASCSPHFSPSSVVALDSCTLVLGTIAMENEVTREANGVEKELTELERMDEELMALAQKGKELDLDLEFDPIMIDVETFMTPMDDLANGFEDLPICGLLNEDQPGLLSDFDLNFNFDDYNAAFSWMDEAPALMNGASPLNIACP